MKIEINMINVEDGDAIFIGMERESGEKALICIDGGYKKFYQSRVKPRLNQMLEKYNNQIRLLVCTHYDNDHLEGAGQILDDHHTKIQEIWVHKISGPLSEQITEMKKGLESLNQELSELKTMKFLAGMTESNDALILESYKELMGFIERLEKYNLENKIVQATRNQTLDGWEEFKVIGPTPAYYNNYLNKLKDEKYLEDIKYNIREKQQIFDFNTFSEMRQLINLSNPCDSLEKSSLANHVTKTNMVSIITLLTLGDKKFLFTGDAGIESFEDTDLLDDTVKNLFWLDVPHHGSKNNTSKNMLEHFNPEFAFVSANGGKNRPSDNIKYCLEKKRTKNNLHITNIPSNTWYIKIIETGKVERVYL